MRAADPYKVCDAVRAVVQDRLAACGRPPITTSYIAAGVVAWDDCCGTLTVGPENAYRTGLFPTPGPDATGCFDGYIAVDVVVVLVRCVPTLDDSGNAPTAKVMNDAYEAVLVDAAVVWNAVAGMADPDTPISGPTQTYVGPGGGCIASETRFTIGIDAAWWCPTCPDQ